MSSVGGGRIVYDDSKFKSTSTPTVPVPPTTSTQVVASAKAAAAAPATLKGVSITGTGEQDARFDVNLDFSKDGKSWSNPLVSPLMNNDYFVRAKVTQHQGTTPLCQGFDLSWSRPNDGWVWVDGLGNSTSDEAVSNPLSVIRVVQAHNDATPATAGGFRAVVSAAYPSDGSGPMNGLVLPPTGGGSQTATWSGVTLYRAASGSTTSTYTVVSGDNLHSIAQALLGDSSAWVQIYNANKALIGPDPNQIYPGQVLTIPGLTSGSPVVAFTDTSGTASVVPYTAWSQSWWQITSGVYNGYLMKVGDAGVTVTATLSAGAGGGGSGGGDVAGSGVVGQPWMPCA